MSTGTPQLTTQSEVTDIKFSDKQPGASLVQAVGQFDGFDCVPAYAFDSTPPIQITPWNKFELALKLAVRCGPLSVYAHPVTGVQWWNLTARCRCRGVAHCVLKEIRSETSLRQVHVVSKGN
jgi:hypothetical protein